MDGVVLIALFLFCVFADLLELTQAVSKRRYRAFAAGTHANRWSHFNSYIRFCIFYGLNDLPASDNNLSLFAEFLCRTAISPTSVLNALSSLKAFHFFLDLDTSGFSSYRYQLTRRAISRSFNHQIRQATPLPIQVLRDICFAARTYGEMGLVFETLCLILFFTLSRLSSLVPLSNSSSDLPRAVMVSDVHPKDNSFTINIKFSKTCLVFASNCEVPIVPYRSENGICPFEALKRLLLTHKRRSYGNCPLFSWLEGRSEESRLNYFTAQTDRELLNKILLMIGQHQEGYTFHSFRRGGCHRAYSRGAALSDIKSLGGWRSDAVEIYLPSNAAKLRVAKTLTG